MALRPTFAISGAQQIAGLLEGLVRVNVDQRLRGQAPSLAASNIRYRREPTGQERWQSAAENARRGYGDCEDLACHLAADIRVRAMRDKSLPRDLRDEMLSASAVTKLVNPKLRHAVVKVGHKYFDPSKARGMR